MLLETNKEEAGNAMANGEVVRTESAPGWLNTLTRQGEKVAALEERTTALKLDTEVIRSAIHDINNKMQAFIALEQQCSSSLKTLVEAVNAHSHILEGLSQTKAQWTGVWWAIVRVCAVIVGAFGILGSTIAFAGWMLEHHVELLVK